MANIKITLDTKQLYPAVVNLKQFSNNTDVLTFEMENYMYETTDLSKLDAYAVCDMVNQEIDEVKLEKQVVENKLRLTWTVTGYTTQLDGHINYQIVFKNVDNDKSVIWFSHQGIIFISESHDADGYIAAKYPTILQQWEERMKTTDANATNAVGQAQASADIATQKANEASQSAAKAESEATDAETNAAKVEEMRDYINQLVNYEGTNFIEKEVVQARKDYDTLGNRLDDMIKGYVVASGNSYDGLASDGGIVVNKIKGAYTESIPEPAPDYQVEPKFFNAKHITSHGRQLFDVNKLAANTVNGITLTSLKDGSLRLSGTATSDASFPVDLTHKETVELFKAGSLYLKGAGMIENAYFTVYLMKSRGETTSELRSDQTISIDQSFLDTESSFVRFYIWIKTGVTVNHIIKPMLYQDGSGEYEPFKYDDVETDIVLRSLPNGVHDEYIDGNILRRIGVMILDGSSDELWAKPTTPAMGSGYSRFLSDALKKLYKAPSGTSISNQNIISDRLKVLAGDSEDYKSSNCIVMQYTDDVLRIVLEDSITGGTLEGMKTWLSSNPIKVYYELATPVIEEYKIPAIGSYYPFTHVQHDSEVDASEIEWHITATSSNTKNIDDIYAILENKMDKVAVFSEDGEEVVKKIDLGFKMKEEEGNVTKGQLLDRDIKGTLYPETTKEQVIGLQEDLEDINTEIVNTKNQLLTGYDTYSGNSYSGSASDYGIEIAKASGNYKQEGTPTPESPVEPKFFEPKHVNTNGGNLFDASKLQTKSENGATVTNNGDGSFTVSGSGNLTNDFNNSYTLSNEELKALLKTGTLYLVCKKTEPRFEAGLIDTNGSWVSGKQLSSVSEINQISITNEDLSEENNYRLFIRFYGFRGNTIQEGTIKPMLYQDGDGTWYPYNTDSTPLSLTLRALPNGVCDTYENGVITRRVGFIEFDGSDDEKITIVTNIGNTNRFRFELSNNLSVSTTNGICDKLPFEGNYTNDKEHFYTQIDNVFIFLNKERANSIEELMSYLQSNPIKVWYELATPTTEQVDLPVIPSYFPYTNAWHDSEVEASDLTWNILSAINGIVTNDWGTENLDKKAPSIQSVLDNLQPKQLLINPDFQVWQRGESISFNDTDTTTNGFKYFADMWCTYFTRGNGDSCTFEKVSNGIKITTSRDIAMSQFMSEALDSNKNYTFVASINGTGHTLTFKGQESKNSELLQYMNKADTSSYDRLIIRVKNNDVVNYVHLWERNITYPHVKKSYQDDLWECMKYVQKLDSRVVPLNKTWGNQRNSVLIAYIALCRTMVSKPTVEVNWSSWIYSSNDSDGYDVSAEICNFIIRVLNNEIDIRITKKDGGVFSKNYDYFINTGNSGILLSCEPLP